MCHSTRVGASSAIVNGTYRDGRSRAKQIAHCVPDESWCQWMSIKNAASSSVTVKTVDIHRPKRRGCKTLIATNDKSAAARCTNQNAAVLRVRARVESTKESRLFGQVAQSNHFGLRVKGRRLLSNQSRVAPQCLANFCSVSEKSVIRKSGS